MPCSQVFSRAWHRLHVFALNSDWFIALFAPVVIGQSNYFGFGFTTSIENRSISVTSYLFIFLIEIIFFSLSYFFVVCCEVVGRGVCSHFVYFFSRSGGLRKHPLETKFFVTPSSDTVPSKDLTCRFLSCMTPVIHRQTPPFLQENAQMDPPHMLTRYYIADTSAELIFVLF